MMIDLFKCHDSLDHGTGGEKKNSVNILACIGIRNTNNVDLKVKLK